jgi:hypothetical protein
MLTLTNVMGHTFGLFVRPATRRFEYALEDPTEEGTTTINESSDGRGES